MAENYVNIEAARVAAMKVGNGKTGAQYKAASVSCGFAGEDGAGLPYAEMRADGTGSQVQGKVSMVQVGPDSVTVRAGVGTGTISLEGKLARVQRAFDLVDAGHPANMRQDCCATVVAGVCYLDVTAKTTRELAAWADIVPQDMKSWMMANAAPASGSFTYLARVPNYVGAGYGATDVVDVYFRINSDPDDGGCFLWLIGPDGGPVPAGTEVAASFCWPVA